MRPASGTTSVGRSKEIERRHGAPREDDRVEFEADAMVRAEPEGEADAAAVAGQHADAPDEAGDDAQREGGIRVSAAPTDDGPSRREGGSPTPRVTLGVTLGASLGVTLAAARTDLWTPMATGCLASCGWLNGSGWEAFIENARVGEAFVFDACSPSRVCRTPKRRRSGRGSQGPPSRLVMLRAFV